MIEKSTLKAQGLAFGRSLLGAIRTAAMYSIDHPTVEKVLQQTYACLNSLVKQTQRFTFGFLNQRLLVNNLLTEDRSLVQLEVEFAKRGIMAVIFTAGITAQEFKRALGLLATKPQIIEEKGGIKIFLEQNPIQGLQIIPARKQQGGDTVLDMEPESYLIAHGILESQVPPGVGGWISYCRPPGSKSRRRLRAAQARSLSWQPRPRRQF